MSFCLDVGDFTVWLLMFGLGVGALVLVLLTPVGISMGSGLDSDDVCLGHLRSDIDVAGCWLVPVLWCC